MQDSPPLFLFALLAVVTTTFQCSLAAEETQEMGNPLGKVLELIDELTAKITAEGEEAEKSYREYFNYCDDVASQKRFEIKETTAKKEKLEAMKDKLTSSSETAGTRIEELGKSIAKYSQDLKDATTIREKEAQEFIDNEAELMDTIDTLERAMGVLEKEISKNSAAFAQMDTSRFSELISTLNQVVDAAGFSAIGKEKLTALVQTRQAEAESEDASSAGAPAAAGYESKSGGIIDVLEDLKEKADEELNSLRKEESNLKHNYNMLRQSLEDSIAADTKDMDAEKAARSVADEENAATEKDLAKTTKDLADSTEALDSIHTECMSVAADHEASVKSSEDELKVLADAKTTLEESTSQIQVSSSSYSLLQVTGRGRADGRSQSHRDFRRTQVANVVNRLAKQYHSTALAQLASRISAVVRMGSKAGEDPFVKVKGLITDLINKLEAEAEASATEKAYCDDEMAKTEEKKGELEADIEKLMAKIDKAAAKAASLKGEVKELQHELATLAKEQAEADEIRRDQNKAYLEEKNELERGMEGVRKALSVLRDYYGASKAAAMLQSDSDLGDAMRQPAKPMSHAKSEGAGSGIIGILEVVESDLAKGLATIDAEESDSQSQYEKMKQETEVTKTSKVQSVTYKTGEFKALGKSLAEASSDKSTKDEELSAVDEYYAKLKDRCVVPPETYEERKKRRDAEIAGLKEAAAILEEETAFVQRDSKRRSLRSHAVTAQQQ